MLDSTELIALERDAPEPFDAVLSRFVLIPFGLAEARETARLQAHLRRAGTPIGERDLQIAATALVHGHRVLTGNMREFARVPGLDLASHV